MAHHDRRSLSGRTPRPIATVSGGCQLGRPRAGCRLDSNYGVPSSTCIPLSHISHKKAAAAGFSGARSGRPAELGTCGLLLGALVVAPVPAAHAQTAVPPAQAAVPSAQTAVPSPVEADVARRQSSLRKRSGGAAMDYLGAGGAPPVGHAEERACMCSAPGSGAGAGSWRGWAWLAALAMIGLFKRPRRTSSGCRDRSRARRARGPSHCI